VLFTDLTGPERELWRAFPKGIMVDLTGREDAEREIRATVIAALLAGAQEPARGYIPALRLAGARVTGLLALSYAEIRCPVRMVSCFFTDLVDLYSAQTKQLNFSRSRLTGLNAGLARINGNFRLTGCECQGQLLLTGTRIAGALLLQDATLNHPGHTALLGNRLSIEDDLNSQGITVTGEYRLSGARIGGAFGLTGARIQNPGQRAFNGFSLTVGFGAHCRRITAEGEVVFSDAHIGADLDLSGASLSNPGGYALMARGLVVGTFLGLGDGLTAAGSVTLTRAQAGGAILFTGTRLTGDWAPDASALSCRYTRGSELVLKPEQAIAGSVDLSHARFETIRDDPGTWPDRLWVDGLSYDTLLPRLPAAGRLAWLDRDPGGDVPQGYEQLADSYRRAGDDAGARTILLAKQRRRRNRMSWYARLWGRLQDITVGYGYRPLRAGGWLCLFAAVGTIAFGLHRPPPVPGAAAPAFNAFVYTVDLMLPLVNLGLKYAYDPQGAQRWLAYVLTGSGWLFVTTIAAGITRVLRRDLKRAPRPVPPHYSSDRPVTSSVTTSR
jgi:hypothetical protein